jgi:O-antigen ligase
MNQTIARDKFRQALPCLLLSCWSLILLANFLPAVPQPASIIGYLWKVELMLAAFLVAAIVLLIKFPTEKFQRLPKREFFLVLAPLLLFTIWSGFSVFWAQSTRAALHHTLLWACYGIFYLLMRRLAAAPRSLAASFKMTGLVVAVLGIACIAEFVSGPEVVSSFFTYRYYKYAEASVTLLPLLMALALKLRSRVSMMFGAIAVIGWLLVLLSLSRTIFIAGFITVGLFFALVFLLRGWRKHLKKSILLLGALALCVFLSQLNFTSSENATLRRFNGNESSQTSFGSRFLFWGMALEAFKQNPVKGVGADNFVSVYRPAREAFSARDPENELLEINEAVLAERAHNEFLQILSELGAVGAILFAWLLAGIAFLFFSLGGKRVSLLSIAALSGIVGFLICSMASSYSFRVPANGLCFFFLLAIAARQWKAERRVPETKPAFFNSPVFAGNAQLAFGLAICASMLVFSAVRGASLMYLQFALSSSEESTAEDYYQKAMRLDGEEATFRYYYGVELFNRGRAAEAVPQLRTAIDQGVATSISYFQLASAQIMARQPAQAELTFAESLKVFPRSVFLRTSYASLLRENGKTDQSRIEFEKASRVSPEQAKSWMTAHTEGVKKLSLQQSHDPGLVKAMELAPSEGIYALLDFQSQFNPNLVRR